MYDKEQILAESYEDKKAARSPNTVRNQETAVSIFRKFCKEKYKESELTICQNLAKESDIKVACAVIQAWVSWSLKQNLSPNTIKSRFFYVKDFMRSRGIKITNQDVADHINLPRVQKEEMYPLSKEELRKIVDVARPKRKSLYLTHSFRLFYSKFLINSICLAECLEMSLCMITWDSSLNVKSHL